MAKSGIADGDLAACGRGLPAEMPWSPLHRIED